MQQVSACRRAATVIAMKCRNVISRSYRIDHVLPPDEAIDGHKTAIVDARSSNQSTFDDLRMDSRCLAERMSNILAMSVTDTRIDPVCRRTVAFLVTNDAHVTVISMFACWISGCTAVLLSARHPPEQWKRMLRDSGVSMAICPTKGQHQAFAQLCAELRVPLCEFDVNVISFDQRPSHDDHHSPALRNRKASDNVGALVMCTSGTTGPPKSVLITHGVLKAQMANAIEAWKINRDDELLNPLPLDNAYGLISGLLCPLSVGATVRIWPQESFDAKAGRAVNRQTISFEMWKSLTSSETDPKRTKMLMAEPSIYKRLQEYYDANYKEKAIVREFIRTVCKDTIRLMVSSSAALLDETASKWTETTGHHLLECYSMTEIGVSIAVSDKEAIRRGFVGKPLPKVEVCIAKPNKYARLGYDVISNIDVLTPRMEAESGEVYVRGLNVFRAYWNNPEETQRAFTLDGWFKTGDSAQYSNGSYRILGCTSLDIIKSGGFQISALDVERHLSYHEDVADCAVFGLPDIDWGQKVAAVVVLNNNCGRSKPITVKQLHDWCKTKMPLYCVPTFMKFVPEIPRNAFGKIDKKSLISLAN